jgi:hypothetical protein
VQPHALAKTVQVTQQGASEANAACELMRLPNRT